MRFSTDDGLFGFIVTPLTDSGLYRFQVVVGGELVGDTEPCFLESAMRSLGKLNRLEDSRLGRVSADPAWVLAVIESDEVLHDAALLQVAESLDGWKVRGYVFEENATLLAQAYASAPEATIGQVLVSIVPLAEYSSIFGAVYRYWTETRHERNTRSDVGL
jgi:hypothetical protein